METYLIVFAAALTCNLALIHTQGWHGHLTMDSSHGVQKIHIHATPRVGGLSIALGLCVGWFLAEPNVRAILGPMLLASVSAFGFGLAEDISKRVSVTARLLATMFSGFVAWYLTGVAMQNTGLAPLDWLLQFTPLAVLCTAFAVGGVANAMNIIDGFNGLASGAAALMLVAMGLIALSLADAHLATVCFLIATCALGFGVVNWPMGKIFLGDGGAYLLGFCVAWMAVLLPMRHAEITAWTTILVCAYPVLEVAFSVARRHRREGHHPGHPDRVHLHHLIHRRVVCQLFPQLNRTLKNGLTSTFCWVLVALPALWALQFASNIFMLVVGLVASVFGYAALYARLSQFRWCFSAATLRPFNRLFAGKQV